jgi:hypothetical protein
LSIFNTRTTVAAAAATSIQIVNENAGKINIFP